eukprot:CAMPEP_0194309628 /NCGR_PEP_ID=MMETSP0171-20130528/6604_1 /TAXON_ID=218684 /ORGANISM="Corethron pennatum, Strain L29A3" /LENGTH=46 /DNA_ID= /DNA_START= /DNA_END= /DNA_ORIENTATION=
MTTTWAAGEVDGAAVRGPVRRVHEGGEGGPVRRVHEGGEEQPCPVV